MDNAFRTLWEPERPSVWDSKMSSCALEIHLLCFCVNASIHVVSAKMNYMEVRRSIMGLVHHLHCHMLIIWCCLACMLLVVSALCSSLLKLCILILGIIFDDTIYVSLIVSDSPCREFKIRATPKRCWKVSEIQYLFVLELFLTQKIELASM